MKSITSAMVATALFLLLISGVATAEHVLPDQETTTYTQVHTGIGITDVTFQLRDSYGNDLDDSENIQLSVTPRDSWVTVSPITNNGDGTYSAQFTLGEPFLNGQTTYIAIFTLFLTGEVIAEEEGSRRFKLSFDRDGNPDDILDEPNGTRTIITQEFIDNDITKVTLQAVNMKGELIQTGGYDIRLEIPNATFGDITDHGDGSYSTVVEEVDPYNLFRRSTIDIDFWNTVNDITGIAGEVSFPNSGFDTTNLNCDSLHDASQACEVSAARSRVSYNPQEHFADGEDRAEIRIALANTNGETLRNAGDVVEIFSIDPSADIILSDVTQVDSTSEIGTYRGYVTTTTPGTYDIGVRIASIFELDDIASVNFVDKSTASIGISIFSGLRAVADNTDIATVSINVRYNNGRGFILGPDRTIEVTAGDGVELGELMDDDIFGNNEGEYSIQATSTTTEANITVTATENGESVTNSAVIEFRPGPIDVSKSFISRTLDDNDGSIFATINLTDEFGNRVNGSFDDYLVTATEGTIVEVLDQQGFIRSTFQVRLSNVNAVTTDISLTINGEDSGVIGSVDLPAKSEISPSETQITTENNGNGSVTLRIQLYYDNNNPVNRDGNTISVGATGAANVGTVTYLGNGRFEVTVTNSTNSTSDISVAVNGENSGSLGTLDFASGTITSNPTIVDPSSGGGGGSNSPILLILLAMMFLRSKRNTMTNICHQR